MSGFELLSEYLTHYFPILFFVVVALFFGVWSLVVSYLVQPKYPEAEKLTSYECGSEPFSDARMPFPVRYYIFAMLFVIFDIEVVFMLGWGAVFKDLFKEMKWDIIIGAAVFLAILEVGHIYLWKKGALDWAPKKDRHG